MPGLDYSRFTKKCYDLAVDALRVTYNVLPVEYVKIESKIKETTEMDPTGISWTTMRIDRKECSTTRRSKVDTGSPFKNWLIKGSFEGATVTMRTSHAIYDSLHADVWYDFKIQPAKTAGPAAPYWIVEVRENGRNAKISLLEDVGIVAELAHLILEYSFPTAARIAIRPRVHRAKKPTVALPPPVEQRWAPDADRNSIKSKSSSLPRRGVRDTSGGKRAYKPGWVKPMKPNVRRGETYFNSTTQQTIFNG